MHNNKHDICREIFFPLVTGMYCCAKTSSQKLKNQLENLEKELHFLMKMLRNTHLRKPQENPESNSDSSCERNINF